LSHPVIPKFFTIEPWLVPFSSQASTSINEVTNIEINLGALAFGGPVRSHSWHVPRDGPAASGRRHPSKSSRLKVAGTTERGDRPGKSRAEEDTRVTESTDFFRAWVRFSKVPKFGRSDRMVEDVFFFNFAKK
jgi:hypothetical protein